MYTEQNVSGRYHLLIIINICTTLPCFFIYLFIYYFFVFFFKHVFRYPLYILNDFKAYLNFETKKKSIYHFYLMKLVTNRCFIAQLETHQRFIWVSQSNSGEENEDCLLPWTHSIINADLNLGCL